MGITKMKKCGTCKEFKELDEFYKDSRRLDGLYSSCKACFSAYNKKRYFENLEEERRYGAEQTKKYRSTAKGKNTIKTYKQSEQGKKANKRYRQSEAGRISSNAIFERRRARLLNAENTLTTQEWNDILQDCGYRCSYCNNTGKMTQDHIVPLSKGGSHTKDNVVPACGTCNSSKGNKNLILWMAQKAGFINV